ncbi:hypothetical protein RyT2_24030 [Pseudolactococcus yaeyamensis]
MYRDDAGRFGWNDVWNGIKKAAKKAVQIVDDYIVKPAVKAVQAGVNWVNKNVIQPVVNLFIGGGSSSNNGNGGWRPQPSPFGNDSLYGQFPQTAVLNGKSYNLNDPIVRGIYYRTVAAEATRKKAEARKQKQCDTADKFWDGVGKFFDQVVKGSYSNNSSKSGTLGEIIVGGIPVVGDAGDIRDAVHGVQTGNWLEVIASGLGVIPFAGGAVKEGVQSLAKEGAQSAAKETAQNSAKETAQQAAKNIPAKSLDDLPDNVQDIYKKYDNNGWNGKVSGQDSKTKAGGNWGNSKNQLPATDSGGNKITYREFDVNDFDYSKGSRDAERFVQGTDGSVYYTADHYETFVRVK